MKNINQSYFRLSSVFFLVIGISITSILTYTAYRYYHKLDEESIKRICQNFEDKIHMQMAANAHILYSSAAFISGSDSVTRHEWHQFQYLNKSHNDLQGIQGLGYIKVVPKHQLHSFEQKLQNEGFADFRISPVGDRDFYTSVLYVEPFSGSNLQVFGSDCFVDTILQKAMTDSRENDFAVFSKSMISGLESAEKQQASIYMFVPVYHKIAEEKDLIKKRNDIDGWAFSILKIDKFFSEILGDWDQYSIRVQIYDGLEIVPDHLMFDSDSILEVKRSTSTHMEYSLDYHFNNNIWTFHFSTYSHQNEEFLRKTVPLLMGGIFISLLLFVLSINLIASRKKSRQIQLLNVSLKKANAEKDRFLSLLAHDLKNPFHLFLGFSEVLDDNFDLLTDEKKKHYTSKIHQMAIVTYSLLEELLIWAKIQSGQLPFQPEKLLLNLLCGSIVGDFYLMAKEKKINIHYNENEDIEIFADEHMLRTIVRNLLTNAIKFTHEGGNIFIDFINEKQWVTVSVIDTGIGLSPEVQSKLFNESVIQTTDGTNGEKGTGLGLLLCKELVEKHGGRIWFESVEGKGSNFSFTMPLMS